MGTLWNGVNVKVVEVSGEQGVGKTLFGMSIDPENTVMIDLEDSSAAYDIPIKKRYSLYEAIAKGEIKVDKDLGVPKPIDCYLWFKGIVDKIKDGEFTVMFVDPLADIEAGLVAWVEENPGKFGATDNEFKKASGLKWGAVNSFWKTFGGTISAKVETFVYTNHMGLIWSSSGSPTGKKKAKGKEALTKICSLRLELEKTFNKETGKQNDIPGAKVIKARFAKSEFIEGRMVHKPYLPPYLQKATYYDICQYIETPPDYANLKDTEVYVEKELTGDEKLLIQQEISANNVLVAESNLESVDFATATAAAREARIQAAKDSEMKFASPSEVVTAGMEQSAVPFEPTPEKPKPKPKPRKTAKKAVAKPQKEDQVTKELKEDLAEAMQKSTLPDRTKVAKIILTLGPAVFGTPEMEEDEVTKVTKDKINQMMNRLDPTAKKLTELSMDQLHQIEDAMNNKIAKKK